MTRALTEAERNTITHALHIAVERYREHVTACGEAPDLARLKAQFERQITEARAAVDLIEQAGEVIVTPHTEG